MSPFDSQDFEFASPQVTRSMPIGHQRLLVLAEFLETKVPPKQFDIEVFKRGTAPTLSDCGTAGCALGWCPSIPEFKALGWRWRAMPVWGRRISTFDSAADFFEINSDASCNFFEADAYREPPTPGDVAARIRAFVAEQSQAQIKSGEANKD